jgi:HK97 family phage major capsid protein
MKLQDLQHERARLMGEMQAMLDKVSAEGRDLSRAERRQFDQRRSKVEEIDDKIEDEQAARAAVRLAAGDSDGGRPFDPRGALDDMDVGLGGPIPPRLKPGEAVLLRDQRMVDWTRARGRGGDFAGVAEGEFSLGRILQARISGDHRGLTEVERRAMAEGTDAAGGVMVPEELSSNIIDRARAQSVIFRAGAITAPMASDTLVLARLATGNTAAWKAENAAVSASDQVWERVELKAKVVVVEQIMSRELFEDMSEPGRQVVEGEIAKAIALKLDLAALEGSGSAPEPRGIANTTGVNSVSMGTNGLKPTSWDQVVNAIFANLKANAAEEQQAVFHPRDLETYALLKDTTNQPLRKPPSVEPMPLFSTTQIKTDRTQGTSSDASNAYVGDFSQLVVGVRPQLQIRFQILQERFSDNLQVGLLAWLRADVAVAHPEHFTKIIGLRIV